MNWLANVLSLGAWGLAGGLILVLGAIARFYQQTTQDRSYYRLFLIPIALYWLGAVLFVPFEPGVVESPVSNILFCLAGVLVAGIGYFLINIMTDKQ